MSCGRDKIKRLIDGDLVCISCERWRAECEARAVLAMPTKEARRLYLRGGVGPDGRRHKGVVGHRGEDATVRLERLIMKLWKKNRKQDGRGET